MATKRSKSEIESQEKEEMERLSQLTISLAEVYQAINFIRESSATNLHKVKISKHLDRVKQLIEEGV